MKNRWPLARLVLSVILVINIWVFAFLYIPKLFFKCLIISNVAVDLDVTSIVLGAVAAFAGLLIPLHYALSLDIVGKIRDSNIDINFKKKTRENIEIERLLRYLHTSDIVVFITAIFGVFSLFEGAITVGYHFSVIEAPMFCKISKLIGFIYLFIAFLSIAFSVIKAKREWNLDYFNKSFIWYCVFGSFIGIFSINWGLALIYLNSANGIAFVALILISLFYLLWLILRIIFTPMSRVTYILLFGENRQKNK